MNILFLSLTEFNSFQKHHIYVDLMREFIKQGHTVFCISPIQKSAKKETYLIQDGNNSILCLKLGNIQKTKNLISKGISTLMVEPKFIAAIKKRFSNIKFDLVLYATPPVTFAKVIRFVKKRDDAKTYLMLKDIFPQNSVDLEMLSKSGVKGLIYKYFRRKEKLLYKLSDKIGCMSQANCDYVLKHNPEVSPDKVEICPNCIDPIDMRISEEERVQMREKYGLPLDKKIFVYGGNLGRPQDVPFIVKCLKTCADVSDAYFVIAGSGTDRHFLEEYVEAEKPSHVKLFGHLPKDEYDKMIACCDVGLIFLDHRFTIPNFPSRLLAYMQAGLPVLACTDKNTDVGEVIVNGGFGYWCESNDAEKFRQALADCLSDHKMSEVAWNFLNENYKVEAGYRTIVSHFN